MEYTLDCLAIHSLDELHSSLAALLSFPDYYGKNFDALHDCLTEQNCTLYFVHWDALETALGLPRCIALRHVLADSAEESNFRFIIE